MKLHTTPLSYVLDLATNVMTTGALGGLACGVDLQTGELAEVAITKAKYGRNAFTTHPVTGVVFGGTRLPFWEETKQPVSPAAQTLLPLLSLGWDVAITEDGPLIIEANQDYDIFLMQDRLGGLRRTPLAQYALENSRIDATATIIGK